MRYGGGGQDLNYLAYMYTVSLLVAVYLATNSLTLDRYLRWLYWGVAAACAMGTLLTGSRGGFACLIASGVFTMVLAGMSRRRIFTIVQILGMALVIYFLVRSSLPSMLLERATLGGGGASLAEDPRIRIWLQGLASVRRNPLFGVGAGVYATVTAIDGGKAYVAHNTFISVAVELGLVGLALYLVYIAMLFRAAWRLPRRERMLWTGCMVIWFLAAVSAGSQIDKFTWFLHTMVLVQAAAYTQTRPARKVPTYPVRPIPAVRGPMPPRAGHV
jgi:O-antigen ligase